MSGDDKGPREFWWGNSRRWFALFAAYAILSLLLVLTEESGIPEIARYGILAAIGVAGTVITVGAVMTFFGPATWEREDAERKAERLAAEARKELSAKRGAERDTR